MKYRHFYALVLSAALFSSCTDIHKEQEGTHVPADTTAKEAAPKATAGEQIFAEKCMACHGNDGTAGIGNAANLQLSQLSHDAIVNTISNGRGGMPAFKAQLTETDIQDLASYVITLRK